MIWTNTKRICKTGFVNFWRNGFVSLASLLVMVTMLFVLSGVLFTSVMLQTTLQQIKDKVDINVYFVTNASPVDIVAIQKSLQALPEVEDAVYTPSDQVLADFKQRHENDQYTLQALDELNSNPLGATITIKAKDPTQYADIVTFLNSKNISQSDDGLPIIDKINYNQNKSAIDTLTRIITNTSRIGFILTIAFIIIAIMITFNTIRLAIYSSREEIGIMQLVGASSMYIRGPFVVVGIMYGLVAWLFVSLLLLPITYYFAKYTVNFFGGLNFYNYYLTHIINISGALLGAGIVVGAVSSYLAVRRYLRI